MTQDEFIKLGCINCGGRDFTRSAGSTDLNCINCEAEYPIEQYGEMDSLDWEKARANATGDKFVEPKTTRYKNDEQFIQNFTENVIENPTESKN